MAQEPEYKLVSGTDTEINPILTTESAQGWRPIMLSSVLVGQDVMSQVILERFIKPKDQFRKG
jgi:hypothetical protein